MNVKNCTRCGRMFQGTTTEKLCSRCVSSDDEEFRVVREYVYDNPDCNVKNASEETGVSEEKILLFLRQGKLILKDDNTMVLDCRRCGAPIKTGKYCDSCSRDMALTLRSAALSANEPHINPNTPRYRNSRRSGN